MIKIWVVINHILLLLFSPYPVLAGWQINFESGVASSGYNDARIPGRGGTLISLSEELKSDNVFFTRIRLNYLWSEKHTLSLLIAPLRLKASGSFDKPVNFNDKVFPANTPLKAKYRFDSYRLTYRYTLHDSPKVTYGIGITAKIRDAAISLADSNSKTEKQNTGPVPLINFNLRWKFIADWAILIDGDALAAPQGRAEDVFAGLEKDVSQQISIKAGYRVLEGGADNDKVYTFALINYAVIGASVKF